MQSASSAGGTAEHTFKVLLIGDSSVGKSSLLTRFTQGSYLEQTPATIGVDFAVKYVSLDMGDGITKRIKLLLWDTAGQEKFRTLTSTFYRGAKGVILVFDVTRESTLRSLEDYWLQETAEHAADMEPVKMVVANKVDMDRREVSWAQGVEFAKKHGCLFVETSAKNGVAVATAFEELLFKILESPNLMVDDGHVGALQLSGAQPAPTGSYCC